MRKISSWTTYFPISERNHFGANIWIPALEIDGYVVAPGETFDFWKAVGPVTRAHGYGDGGAIINGRTEPQGALAGGICSCSTTLFNAALRGRLRDGRAAQPLLLHRPLPDRPRRDGLQERLGLDPDDVVDERHGLPGPDPRLQDPERQQGLRPVRPLQRPDRPEGLIGAPTIKNIRRASDTVQYTSSLAPGSRSASSSRSTARRSGGRSRSDENGKILRQKTYYSHYARITGIVLVGRSAD